MDYEDFFMLRVCHIPSRPPPCHQDSQSSACRCRSPEQEGGTAMGDNTQFPILQMNQINLLMCNVMMKFK